MTNCDKEYLRVLDEILKFGKPHNTRAGRTLSLFGAMMHFDISDGKIPLLTTKKVFVKGIIHELLWFLSGSTNIKYLVENGVHIWDDDAYRYYLNEIQPYVWGDRINSKEEFVQSVLDRKEFCCQNKELVVSKSGVPVRQFHKYIAGDLGPVYGKQWRKFGGSYDQIGEIVRMLKEEPDSRRIILNAWNPKELSKMALPPCHILYQFSTRKLSEFEKQKYGKERALSCCFFMRSNDFTNGNPFNIAQAAMLSHILAHVCDMATDELVFFGGDVHIYENNIEQARLQLEREGSDVCPTIRFGCDKNTEINKFKYEDFIIENYYPDEAIKYNLNTGLKI